MTLPADLPPDLAEMLDGLVPPSFADAYMELLHPETDPEAASLAEMFAAMIRSIPGMLGMQDRSLIKLLDSVLPIMTLQMRGSDPQVIREGITATLGAMLHQCAKGGIPLEDIVRWMRDPPPIDG